jgi:hypothetical protein
MTLMISCIRLSDSGRIVALSKSNWIFSAIVILLSLSSTRFGGSGSGMGSGSGGGGGFGGSGGGSPMTCRAVWSSNTVGPQAMLRLRDRGGAGRDAGADDAERGVVA